MAESYTYFVAVANQLLTNLTKSMIDIKPGPELNAAVANACGLHVDFLDDQHCMVRSREMEVFWHGHELRNTSDTAREYFRPSDDIRTAFRSAVNRRLFNGHRVLHYFPEAGWFVLDLPLYEFGKGSRGDAEPELALCRKLIELYGAK